MKEKIEKENEEKYSANFIVEFPEEFNLPSWTVMKANKPKYLNSEWLSIEIEFIDSVKHSTSKSLFKLIKNVEIQKNNNIQILFSITIKIVDKTGNVAEEWKIAIKDIEMIDFGDLNNNSQPNDILIKPKLRIKPSFCEYVSN